MNISHLATSLKLRNLPIEDLLFVGSLLLIEYPITNIYADSANGIFITEWVDMEGEENKFFIYQTTLLDLRKFIDKQISHFELIKSTHSGIVIFFNGNIKNPSKIYACQVDNIPSNYLPLASMFFDDEESRDLNKIKQRFGLNELAITEEVQLVNIPTRDIEYLSEKSRSELFEIHLNNGRHVQHGIVDTEILGKTLIGFQDFYHECAKHYKNPKETNKHKINEFNRFSKTEVVLNVAASFAVFLRPKPTPITIDFGNPEGITMGEVIFSEAISIIRNSSSETGIATIRDTYGTGVFSKLRDFADHISKNNLDVNFDYYSPITKNRFEDRVNATTANNIIYTIDTANSQTSISIKVNGRFTMLNCKTGHFSFISEDNFEYKGYLYLPLRERMAMLNFADSYEIVLSKEEKISNTKKVKIEYTLTAHSKITEQKEDLTN